MKAWNRKKMYNLTIKHLTICFAFETGEKGMKGKQNGVLFLLILGGQVTSSCSHKSFNCT